jgi:hypothetical protein
MELVRLDTIIWSGHYIKLFVVHVINLEFIILC